MDSVLEVTCSFLKNNFEAQRGRSRPLLSWQCIITCHSRIIENGQRGGTWVELVAKTTPTHDCHSSGHTLNYAEL